MRGERARGDERGFALLAVMLVLALLGVVLAEFAYSMRLEASMVRAHKESLIAGHLAEAGVHQAIREILSQASISALDEDGQIAFYQLLPGQTTLTRIPNLQRSRVPLGAGEFSYRISDEESRVHLNLAASDRFERLLTALGVPKEARDVIQDSLQDWKDTNDEHRANGAESDHYLKLPVPYRARNAYLQDQAELLQLRGMTPELYWGAPDRPGLAELVTVFGRNLVNLNTAAPAVLSAMGLSDAEVTDVVQTRVRAPYPSVPGRFTAVRGFAVTSQTFRIEAEGIVAGEPKARVVAIVQRRTPRTALPDAPPPLPFAIVAWRVPGER